jgi:3',5'-cyclic AMP phosphodiesterase CpdA
MNGDMVNSFYKPDQLFTSFIDVSVEKFATEKPFAMVRGNHETRGPLARQLKNFILRPNGTIYGLYMLGTTAVLMLDSGEDKYDHHREYYGATAFDRYREEQAVWLKAIVQTEAFRNAERRIVIVHIPPFYSRQELDPARPGSHSLNEVNRLFMPVLNSADVDLMLCGHTHRHSFLDIKEGENNFPILVNDNDSIIRVESSSGEIKVEVINEAGEETFNRVLN